MQLRRPSLQQELLTALEECPLARELIDGAADTALMVDGEQDLSERSGAAAGAGQTLILYDHRTGDISGQKEVGEGGDAPVPHDHILPDGAEPDVVIDMDRLAEDLIELSREGPSAPAGLR